MSICVCKYPLIIVDIRDGDIKEFISIPLEIADESFIPIPDMEVVEEKGFDDKIGKYMKVTWNIPSGTPKRYNINEHIVLAGCPEEELQCSTKSIFEVYHPIDEWNAYHMLELKDKT